MIPLVPSRGARRRTIPLVLLAACIPVPNVPTHTAPVKAAASPEVKPLPKPKPSIHAGSCHTCTLDAEGRVACWGCNTHGQLGDGTREDRATPVAVEGLGPVTELSLGSASTCVVDGNGGVWCWGANEAGQCGRPGEDALRPALLSSFEHATRVTVGGTSACALTEDRQLWCWGEDRYRGFVQLGVGSGPVRVDEALDIDVVDVRADASGNTCALDAAGTVTCWGPDLGDWDSSDLPSTATPEERHQDFLSWGGPKVVAHDVVGFLRHTWPVCVWQGPADAPRWECLRGAGQERLTMPAAAPRDARPQGPPLAMSWQHGCAVESGRVRCWGDERLLAGRPTTGPDDGLDDALQVAIGAQHACVLRQGGAITCWGNDRHLATGDASMALPMPSAPAPEESARRRLALHGIVDMVAENTERPCAIEQGGTVRCLVDERWLRVPGLRNVVELSAGDSHACARTAEGAVQCWGQWYFGPYNHDGDESDFLRARRPRRIAGLRARAIESWGETDCALAIDGSVQCWGRHHGESLTPRRMKEASDLVELSMSERWACGIDAAGAARCWTTASEMNGDPELALDDVAELALAGDRGCARHRSGTVSCWGEAPVGDGTWSDRTTPVAVVGLRDVVELSVGITHACARSTGGEVHCWGDNEQGQLGDGTAQPRIEPTLATLTHDLGPLVGVGAGVAVASWQPYQTTLTSHTATVVWTEGGDVWMWGERP